MFFSLVILCATCRLATRVYTRSCLYIDDYLVIIALICLTVGTGLLYSFCQRIFVIQAVKVDPTVIIPPDLYDNVRKYYALTTSFLFLIWTSIFAVKLSFLALFRLLIRRVGKVMTRYYWIAVATTVVTWMFLVNEPFMLCPYVTAEKMQRVYSHLLHKPNFLIPSLEHCNPQSPYALTLSLRVVVTALDVLTDAMSRFSPPSHITSSSA